MSKKQIVVLGAIAAALLAAVLVQELRRKGAYDLAEEMGLRTLAPDGFLASDVRRIEICQGKRQDDKVILARDADAWRVETRFNAPGKKDKIEEFLKKLKSLEGEFRSEGAAVLADYQLTDETALHVALLKSGEETASYRLLTSKKPGYGGSFVRLPGEDRVYSVNVDIRSEVGIWGDNNAEPPKSSEWLEKDMVKLDKSSVVRLALTTPDRAVVFEKREKKTAAEGDADAHEEGAEKEEGKPKEMEWALVEGGPGPKGGPGVGYRQSGLDAVLKALDPFSASDVEDPAKKKDLGLDAPAWRCEVKLDSGAETIILAAAEPGSDGYAVVQGRNVAYKVDSWKFKLLFKEGRDLFDLKGLDEKREDVQSVSLDYGTGTVELSRKEAGGWALDAPQAGLQLDDSKADSIPRALAGWKPGDYVDAGDDLAAFGLAPPARTAAFAMKSGMTHTIALGAAARGTEGRYALLDGAKRVWVARKFDAEDMFPDLKSLFKLDDPAVKLVGAVLVAVERGGAPFTLEQKDGKWTLASAGETFEADWAAVSRYLARLAAVKAEDVALEGEWKSQKTTATVRVQTAAGEVATLELAEEKDGRFAMRVVGRPVIFFLAKETAGGLAPPLDELRKKAAPAPAPEAAAP